MSIDFHQTCVQWYCGDLVLDCWWANFVNFWQSYLPTTHPYFHFWTITLVNINGFSANLVCALIVEICFGIANGQISSIFDSYLSAIHPYFTFRTMTWVNLNGFSPNLICVFILWRSALGLLIGKFRQFFICWRHDNGGVLSFLILLSAAVVIGALRVKVLV